MNGNNNNTQFAEWELYQRKNQSISFGDIVDKTFGDEPFELVVSANSGLPVQLELVAGAGTIDAEGFLILNGAGSFTIRATQAGDQNYFPVTLEKTFVVAKAEQAVSINNIQAKTFGEAPFAVVAGSSSGLPVRFEIVAGPAAVSEQGVITINGAGTVTVRAIQPGNDNYLEAVAETSFTVAKAMQSISFNAITDKHRNEELLLTATASSGLTVAYLVEGPATLQNNTLHFTGEGRVTIKALQQGNENYLAADTITRSFMVYGTDNKTEDFRLLIAPNPTRGPLSAIILNKKRDRQYNFYLYNFSGRLIQSCIIAKNSLISVAYFNLQHERNGQYYLYVTNGEQTLVRIIIKQ